MRRPNALRRNYYGFKFNNAVIGKQGEPSSTTYPAGLASDNKWIANQGLVKNEGNLNLPTEWFYRSIPTNDPNIHGVQNLVPIALPNNATGTCSVGGPIGPVPKLRAALSDVAAGTQNHTGYGFDHVFWENGNVTRMFMHDTAWLYLDPATDQLFQQFVQTQLVGSTGRLMEAETAIATCDSAGVVGWCSTVAPNCQKETDLTGMYQLLAQKYIGNEVLFTAADSAWLWDLACSDGLIEGAAVYTARAVLAWPFGCAQTENRSQIFPDNNEVAYSADVTIYPNPGNGLLNIMSDFALERIIVRDVSGKVVFTEAYTSGRTVQLDLEQLNAGLYILECIGAGNNRELKYIKL